MQDDVPAFDALILAGGRSSRLGGVPKQGLLFRGATLLARSLAAAEGARTTVVVGPDPGPLPPGVLTCREEPEFAGPAAAIAAGLDVLDRAGSAAPHTLVLACDMPLVSGAVRILLQELSAGQRGGSYVACTGEGNGTGRMQPLAGIYSTDMLKRSALEMAAGGRLIDGSVRSLLASLDVQLVAVPAAYTADVDTWDDAAALGIAAGTPDVEDVDGAGNGRS
ncbi:molybdenum cofactor guanylyltransferase [Pseudarthrobacter chlorophenolicus]|nr:NTP transferase domain-containing protein [Pseudarthrobacter chlorophenolicus]SDR07090.1 Molybdopterin-guanine dinucleotide biosynthesis protein A [Pseudarthrobacter chlorophenolicus]